MSDEHPAGSTVEAGLPDITGRFNVDCGINGIYYDGAFTLGWVSSDVYVGSTRKNNSSARLDFYASKSNSIYGSNSTVQPPAYFIYIWKRVE